MDNNVRCIYCLSGDEEKVKASIERTDLGEVIIPMKEKPFRANGVWENRIERLLPGYLFVFGTKETDYYNLSKIDGVVRILTYGNDPEDSYLRGSDLKFAMMIKEKEGLISTLAAIKEGDYIRISDGALQGVHGTVIGINKRRHMVNVEVRFLGEQRNIWLGYEMIGDIEQ